MSTITYPTPIYKMATKAIHAAGDISRDEPDLCVVHSETIAHYIGNWIFGFGFVDVKFPRNTTRDLNQKEMDQWNGQCYSLGSMIYHLEIPEATNNIAIPTELFEVHTKNTIYRFDPSTQERWGRMKCWKKNIDSDPDFDRLDRPVKITFLAQDRCMWFSDGTRTSKVQKVILPTKTLLPEAELD